MEHSGPNMLGPVLRKRDSWWYSARHVVSNVFPIGPETTTSTTYLGPEKARARNGEPAHHQLSGTACPRSGTPLKYNTAASNRLPDPAVACIAGLGFRRNIGFFETGHVVGGISRELEQRL